MLLYSIGGHVSSMAADFLTYGTGEDENVQLKMYNVQCNAMRNDAAGENILRAFFRPLGIVKEIFCFCGFFRKWL